MQQPQRADSDDPVAHAGHAERIDQRTNGAVLLDAGRRREKLNMQVVVGFPGVGDLDKKRTVVFSAQDAQGDAGSLDLYGVPISIGTQPGRQR